MRSFALLTGLVGASAAAQNSSIMTAYVPMYQLHPQLLDASVVSANPDTTTYRVGCPRNSGQECYASTIDVVNIRTSIWEASGSLKPETMTYSGKCTQAGSPVQEVSCDYSYSRPSHSDRSMVIERKGPGVTDLVHVFAVTAGMEKLNAATTSTATASPKPTAKPSITPTGTGPDGSKTTSGAKTSETKAGDSAGEMVKPELFAAMVGLIVVAMM